MKQYGSVTQCFQESKRVLDFIAANPIIEKMADRANNEISYDSLFDEAGYSPWSFLLTWDGKSFYALHGCEDEWFIEEWGPEGGVVRDTHLGPLDVDAILSAMGISAHDLAEFESKGGKAA